MFNQDLSEISSKKVNLVKEKMGFIWLYKCN